MYKNNFLSNKISHGSYFYLKWNTKQMLENYFIQAIFCHGTLHASDLKYTLYFSLKLVFFLAANVTTHWHRLASSIKSQQRFVASRGVSDSVI